MKVYNKLVRDRIPEILAEKKIQYNFHIADNKEYLEMLYKKVLEELEEFKKDPSIQEFADLMEVLENIARIYKFDVKEIKTVKKAKKISRGGFDNMIILETTD